MESQALAVHRSSAVAAGPSSRRVRSVGMHGADDLSLVRSSLGKQQLWRFKVEKKVTLSPGRRHSNAARAKKADTGLRLPGSLKLKKSEEPVGENGKAGVEKGAEKLGKLFGSIKASAPAKVPTPVKRTVSRKDKNVVFVAGATGRVGRRVVRELVQLGYSVKAGTRNPEKAGFLLEFAGVIEKPETSATGEVTKAQTEPEPEPQPEKRPGLWANFGLDNIFGFLGKKAPGVELVEVNLEKPDEIEEALGEASVVVCTIGASDKEALNVTAPYRIDYKATENLIKAATSAKVNHFVLVTSLGTTQIGWPATALNLFWCVLMWKAKAEKALIESGIPFTIVRPGGMERPTDAYKETHNLLLDKADSRFGGQVSNLQVAELIASAVGNLKLAEDKILEAVAETTAPLRSIEDLLAEIPTISASESEKLAEKEGLAAKKAAEKKELAAKKAADDEVKQAKMEEARAAKQRAEEEKQAKREELIAAKKREEEEKAAKKEAERLAKLRAEEERIAAQERRAAEQAKLQALREKLQDEYAGAKEREEEAKRVADEALLEKEEIERKVANVRSRIEEAAQVAREAKALQTAVTAAAREGKTLSEREKRSIVASERAKIDAEAKQKAAQEKAMRDAEAKAEKERRAAEAKAAAEKEKKAKETEAAKVKAEEQRKAEAAKAEADKKAKAEAKERELAEKKKAEAEAKKKAEEEKKAKAEAELKAKAEAEKKAKAEEERKAKEEAEKKVKAEAEAKAKAEAETKARAEEEKRIKLEAEKKAKAEAEKKTKAEAETKAKAEAEAKAKAEAEEKAKVEEEKKTKAEAEAKAKLEKEKKAKEETEAAKAAKEAEQAAAKAVEVVASGSVFKEGETPDIGEDLQKLAAQIKEEVKTREQQAVEKAKSAAGFVWPWQWSKPTDGRPAAPKKASPVEGKDSLPPASTPPSPFARYPDLKPPTSPTPSPPTPVAAKGATKTADAPPAKEPSSNNGPVDMKPKSSPAPNAEDSKKKEIAALAAEKSAEVATREKEALDKAKAATTASFVWPWERLRWPKPGQKSSSTDLPRTNRPLSPYWMYPDLKPPTSPMPSANKDKV